MYIHVSVLCSIFVWLFNCVCVCVRVCVCACMRACVCVHACAEQQE